MLSSHLIKEILHVANLHGEVQGYVTVKPLEKFGQVYFNGREWRFHEETAIVGDFTERSVQSDVYGPGEWSRV